VGGNGARDRRKNLNGTRNSEWKGCKRGSDMMFLVDCSAVGTNLSEG